MQQSSESNSPAANVPERPKPTRALVTGCAGFIGSHLTESLLNDGVDVLGVDCFNANYGRPEKLANLNNALDWDRFEFVPLDLSRGDLGDLVADVDVVFHLAAEPGVRSSWGQRFERYVANNIVATQHLLRALVEHPGKRVVYASSSSIYGQAEALPTWETTVPAPRSPYGLTKLSGEHLFNTYWANYGIEVASMRYFTVFGPRQRPDMAFNIFCRAALRGDEIVVYGDGEQSRDFTFVSDIVAATKSAGTSAIDAGGAYNVGGGVTATLNEILSVIGDLAGSPLNIVRHGEQAGDVRHTGAATRKAREHLAYDPKVSLQDGIAREFEWLRGQVLA